MTKLGQPSGRRVNDKNRAETKQRVLEELAKGRTIGEAAETAGTARRTVTDWRQKDERFAVKFAAAMDARRDVLVKSLFDIAMDENAPYRDRVIALIFLTKQADPSFRDNTKLEVAPSPGLAKGLAELAKAAEQDERLA